ncbi:MAG: EF-P lysine aminoacylase EpmA [Woeseiaceae bacterium]
MTAQVHDTGTWRPASQVETAKRRAYMLLQARDFFAARQVLEVDTPALSRTAASDPHIESLEVRLQLSRESPYYLQTSPEFCMKRLLCAGYPNIYQICKVFRDNEAGRRHQPEFTMVEWYRLDFGLREIMEDTIDFLSTLIEPRNLPRSPQFLEYRDAFLQFAGVDPLEAPVTRLAEACNADGELTALLGDRRDDWLDLILASRIAPQLPAGRLTVLCHYPAEQAALARLCPDNASVADRFEVFLGERELANGYVELRDATEQSRRFENDQAIRRTLERPVRSLDRRFIAALQAGLPACAGVAVGFDRLLMINETTDDIRQVQTFAFDESASE